MKDKGFNTRCVHAGTHLDPENTGINSPIYTSTSYHIDFFEKIKNPYPRYQNTPNTESLAAKLCQLENAKHGFVTASGMAAISTVILSCLGAGDHAIFQKEIYGGSFSFIERELNKYGIELTWVEYNNIEAAKAALKANTKLYYIESPSNPLLKIVDLQASADFAKENNLITVIDNTFATPVNQNPLDWGIDVVVHSATKYLGGHSDMVCGAILLNSDSLYKLVLEQFKNHGAVLDAIASYQLERSLKTLGLRVERQCYNAQKIAEYLESHNKISKVNYPGLKSFAGHELAAKQMRRFGAMMSCEIDGDLEDTKRFIMGLKTFSAAVSLGGVESLATIPRITSHSRMTREERTEAGIVDNLVRLSIGIEDIDDLIQDLEQALSHASTVIAS